MSGIIPESEMTRNPFFEDWSTPFGMPPFNRIRPEHFAPAFDRGMQEQAAEIEAISGSAAAPSFTNTIEALERSGRLLERVSRVFFNLDATEEQLNFPTYYGSGKNGWFNDSLTPIDNIEPLLDGILKHVPPPKVNEGPLQMQITSLDYSSFLGRIAIGKVSRGVIKESQTVALVQADGSIKKSKVKELYQSQAEFGLEAAEAGDRDRASLGRFGHDL